MATLTEWTLPLNRNNPYPFYLQYLTPERNGLVYYTKYSVEVVGQLDVTKTRDNVVEWEIPPRLFEKSVGGGGAAGIVYGPRDDIWFTLEIADQLVHLNPSTGIFTGFYGSPGPFPMPMPRDLAFDESGRIWHTGADPSGAVIGCFDPSQQRSTYWLLPSDFLTPASLWVEASGKNIWFTLVNPNQSGRGPLLARLQPSTGHVEYWGPTVPVRPVVHGVVGDPAAKPKSIWFTYDRGSRASRVYRLHIPSGTFYEYAPDVAGSPWGITVDRSGTAWIADSTNRIRSIKRDADCGTTVLESSTIRVKPVDMECRSHEYIAEATISTAAVVQTKLTAAQDNCYAKVTLPNPQANVSYVTVAAGPGKRRVYFTENGINTIGRLH